MSKDPIHYVAKPERRELDNGRVIVDQPGWYFWDESWAHRFGPFTSRQDAARQLRGYCDSL